MIDQAEKLRRRMNNDLPARTLAIISGKAALENRTLH